ncbi:hypothetical protein BDM02DRAFT_3186490 [Thelephora ganbajun]|uniref:Uncharacterized protein n=1 Tax=Thelephora ganbajun TaxID=370292 RepID=A0ACB6ZI18_THEGA|nr:hypothetical protein BDM02DRAFT_3186490 [Thelephora ganbajun]
MSQHGNGDALWEPAPLPYFKRVQPGDVGYIRAGCFHLLFSAGYPLGKRQLGIDAPFTFEKLDIGLIIDCEPRVPGYLHTEGVRVTGARLPPSASPVPMLESGSRYTFQLTGGQGAILVTKYQTYREDIQRMGDFEKYTKKHYGSWVAFAEKTGHGSDVNPVLVTGVDRTRDFAMVSYSNVDNLKCEFTTSVPEVASASAWGTWEARGFVHTTCGPQSRCVPTQATSSALSGNSDTETVSDEYDQCVFVRYYTMRKRLGIPKIIRAGAGPHDLGPGCREGKKSPKVEASSTLDSGSDIVSRSCGDDRGDDRSPVVTIGTESNIIVHNTIANSDADSALIHHRDIALLREPGGSIDLSAQLLERRPSITVDGDGAGTIECQADLSTDRRPYDTATPTPLSISSKIGRGKMPGKIPPLPVVMATDTVSAKTSLMRIVSWDGKSQNIYQVLTTAFEAKDYLDCIKDLRAQNIDPPSYINSLDKVSSHSFRR